MIIVTIMSILSGVGFQQWSVIEQREREQELLFIQRQYAMALLEYQSVQGAPPTELDQLDQMSGQNKRFIRRMWLDPMTRDAEGGEEGLDRWCIIQQGPSNEILNSCPTTGPAGEEEGGFQLGEAQPLPTTGQGQPIIGVASRSDKSSYLHWNDRKTYREWLYTTQDLEAWANQLAVFQ